MSHKNEGFTLVELLFVVIILGVLAAIVISQFTETTSDANESALASSLQRVRSQIELYKTEHLSNVPGLQADGSVNTADFIADLTGKTDMAGAAGTDYGSYLLSFPVNPFNLLATLSVGAVACPGDNSTGWYFNTTSNKFSPNDNADPAHKDM